MKIAKKLKLPTRKGAASIYIVIFTAILLGVIAVSFIRIILSESRQTTNYDLSQSAYDAALAGIEDAKVALLKYHECISNKSTANASDNCSSIINLMRTGINSQSCDTVQTVLGREQGAKGEVIIQETQKSSDQGNSVSMQQAYTCVKIQEDLDDYRTTLSSQDRTRLIPIRSIDNNKIHGIKIRWFSANNRRPAQKGTMKKDKFDVLEKKEAPSTPPVLIAQVIQTSKDFYLSQLNYNSPTNLRSNRATLVLHPVSKDGMKHITWQQVSLTNDKKLNKPFNIQCEQSSSEFECNATFSIPSEFSGNKPLSSLKDLIYDRNPATFFLRLTLPYGTPTTDVSVELCDDNDWLSGTPGDCSNGGKSQSTKFIGVQSKIDSTGRANDLYRRLEARVELVDTHFPYPEFAVQLSGEDSKLEKDFYSTKNCWYSDGNTKESCANNGDAKASNL